MSDEMVSGRVVVEWSVRERDLGTTEEQVARARERLDDLLSAAVPQWVDLYIDGDDKAPVRIYLERSALHGEI